MLRYTRALTAPITSVATLALALAACGGTYRRANAPGQPSETTTTGAAVDVGPGSPDAPSGVQPNSGSTWTTSPAPASPMLGGCPEGEPRGAANDRVSCLESCRGFDDTVPLGSRCISQYADCNLKCEAKFFRAP
jgi:hypothetical protein